MMILKLNNLYIKQNCPDILEHDLLITLGMEIFAKLATNHPQHLEGMVLCLTSSIYDYTKSRASF